MSNGVDFQKIEDELMDGLEGLRVALENLQKSGQHDSESVQGRAFEATAGQVITLTQAVVLLIKREFNEV